MKREKNIQEIFFYAIDSKLRHSHLSYSLNYINLS